MLTTRWRIICWPLALMLAAVSLAWALTDPGDAAYWIGGMFAVPALILGAIEMESAWPSMSPATRVVLVGACGACALAGLVYAVASPGTKSYLVGGLLCYPLMVVLMPVLTRDEDDEEFPSSMDGPWGPPAA